MKKIYQARVAYVHTNVRPGPFRGAVQKFQTAVTEQHAKRPATSSRVAIMHKGVYGHCRRSKHRSTLAPGGQIARALSLLPVDVYGWEMGLNCRTTASAAVAAVAALPRARDFPLFDRVQKRPRTTHPARDGHRAGRR